MNSQKRVFAKPKIGPSQSDQLLKFPLFLQNRNRTRTFLVAKLELSRPNQLKLLRNDDPFDRGLSFAAPAWEHLRKHFVPDCHDRELKLG